MTNDQAKATFNKAIDQAKDADQIARLELMREYFTNPAFRASLEQFTFDAAVKS